MNPLLSSSLFQYTLQQEMCKIQKLEVVPFASAGYDYKYKKTYSSRFQKKHSFLTHLFRFF